MYLIVLQMGHTNSAMIYIINHKRLGIGNRRTSY